MSMRCDGRGGRDGQRRYTHSVLDYSSSVFYLLCETFFLKKILFFYYGNIYYHVVVFVCLKCTRSVSTGNILVVASEWGKTE